MISRTKARDVFAALGLAGVLLVTSGCTDTGGAPGEDFAALTKEVKESQRLNKALLDRLDRLERKIDGHTQDIDRLSRQRVANELAAVDVAEIGSDEGSEASLASALGGDVGVDVAGLLDSESGRAAVEKAMAAVQEKRDSERRERWVGAMVDRFATDANLSSAQTQDMRRITTESFKKIGELWSGMRGDATPDERAMQREEAMVKMEEIRQATNEEVKAVLSADQYTLYEEQVSRMRGGFGGGGPGGAARRGGGR